jgi:hypothetical protein
VIRPYAALLFFLAILPAVSVGHGVVPTRESSPRVIEFPDTADRRTLVVDLHTHSIFSDGHVWPTIRVAEAERDGLDAMAVTEHLEYQPHIVDIPHPDRNRSFEEARRAAAGLDLAIIPGVEITRQGEAGHINAVFVEDANALVEQRLEHVRQEEHMFDTREKAEAYAKEMSGMFSGAHQVEHEGRTVWMPFADEATYLALANFAHATTRAARDVLEAANAQGAFLFWNHPDFESVEADLNPFHAAAVRDGLLHGIEIANGDRYYQNAHRLALEHDLALIGVSDVHELIDWDYRPEAGEDQGHRPVTLIFATDTSLEAMKQALDERRTVVYWKDLLIGRSRDLLPLLEASIEIAEATVEPWGLRVRLANSSDAPMSLRNENVLHMGSHGQHITLPAHGETEVTFSMDESALQALEFTVLNALVAPNEPARIRLEQP